MQKYDVMQRDWLGRPLGNGMTCRQYLSMLMLADSLGEPSRSNRKRTKVQRKANRRGTRKLRSNNNA
jgi:hypothetical protein